MFCHQVCTLIRDSLYYFEHNADDALVLEELFAADVYLHLLHVTLRRKAAAAVVFGHCVLPLLKSLDVKKKIQARRVSLDQVNAGLIRDNHLLLLYIIIFSSIID